MSFVREKERGGERERKRSSSKAAKFQKQISPRMRRDDDDAGAGAGAADAGYKRHRNSPKPLSENVCNTWPKKEPGQITEKCQRERKREGESRGMPELPFPVAIYVLATLH